MQPIPLRTTVIGSYPFPGWLEFASQHLGEFGPADLAEMQDDAVVAAIHDQTSAGLDVITDGEQTRYEIIMLTKDSASKVASYYQDTLKLESTKDGDAYKLFGFTPKHNSASIDISKHDEMTKIDVVSLAGGL